MGTPIEPNDVQGTPESSPGPNPAWSPVLEALPPEFHSVVTPHFQQWDQAAQKRVEEANSKVNAFSGYQEFVDNGISAENLQQGMQLMYQLNTDPEGFYKALQESYGYGSADDSEEEEEGAPQTFQDPRFDQLQQGIELVAQTVLTQQQETLKKQAAKELDTELASLREKHGDFNEQYVLSIAAVNDGVTLEQAVESYKQMVNGILQQNPRPFAPTVMGNSSGGTGLPSQAIDPTKLGGKETRNLVVQMLKAANEGN